MLYTVRISVTLYIIMNNFISYDEVNCDVKTTDRTTIVDHKREELNGSRLEGLTKNPAFFLLTLCS